MCVRESQKQGAGERCGIDVGEIICLATLFFDFNIINSFTEYFQVDKQRYDLMTPSRHIYTKKQTRQWIQERLMSHLCADNRDMWCVCLCPVEGESCVMLLSNRLSVSSTNKPATLSPNILFLRRPELLVPSSSSCPLPTASNCLPCFLSVFSFWLWKSDFWTCYQLQRTNTFYRLTLGL